MRYTALSRPGRFACFPSLAFLCLALFECSGPASRAGDQPQWGQAWSRNMVSDEKGLPDSFDPKTGRNVRWVAPLGSDTHSTPVVAGGRVYIGTNNGQPRDARHEGDRGVLLCLDESNGTLLWQLVSLKREEDPFHDWPKTGISSPATVEGQRVYVVDNRGEVLCLDARGLANGNDGPFRDEALRFTPRGSNAPAKPLQLGPLDADILWQTDLTKVAGIWSHDAAHASILLQGELLYLNSGTGVDNTHRKIRDPNAPSLLVLDKRNGRLLARDGLNIASTIFHCTWSSPSLGTVNGQPRLFFAGGNGMLYGFVPLDARYANAASPGEFAELKTVWQFDFDSTGPKTNVHRFTTNRREGPSNIFGMPVFHEGRLYVAGGGDLFWGKNEAWLKCIRVDRAPSSGTNSLVWSYPLEKHVLATPAVFKDMVFIADCGRKMHCVDATSGQALWTHDIQGEVWASPLVADGKVFLGTRSGQFLVFAASREKKLISSIELGDPISATATAANDCLYVATMRNLYALRATR